MKIEPTSARDVFGSLTFRLLALLTIALTPIGAIAVYQTSALSSELDRRAEIELLNATSNAVAEVRQTFENAFGAAEALAATSSTIVDSPGACMRLFERFIGGRTRYTFAGILPADGIIRCSSVDTELDVSVDERRNAIFRSRLPFVNAIDKGLASEQPAILIGTPVLDGDELLHYVVVSIPRRQLYSGENGLGSIGAFSVSTYNSEGDVLLTSDVADSFTSRPVERQLSELTRSEGHVFRGTTQSGEPRVFSAVRIYSSYVYAIASWPPGRLDNRSNIAAWLFPIVMWLSTLLVTYVALNRLVIRHVRNLGRQMRRFARDRTLPELRVEDDQPAELFDMHASFRAMAEAILQDEAELEDAIHEKNGLIREVHHRVKNNLQLIASIMNMQIRKSRNSETSNVVRRLQDRVLGLAAIHRQMYQAPSMAEIPIALLLDEALKQTVNLDPSGRVDYTCELTPLQLNSDQAVPLALLASEATLNAVKYVGAKEGTRPWIRVSLDQVEGDLYRLTIANSRAPADENDEEKSEKVDPPAGDAGLGMQLVRAFAGQLEGQLKIEETEESYTIILTFEAKDIEQQYLPTSNANLVVKDY